MILIFQASEKVQKSVFQLIDTYQKKFKTNKVFLSSKQINIYWAHVTVVKAELICFEDLLEFPQANWKYIITTAGSELPNYSHKMLRSDIKIILSFINENTFMVHFVKLGVPTTSRILTGDSQKLSFLTLTKVPFLIF